MIPRAQITIGPGDMPSANETYRYSIAGTTSVDPAVTGPGHTWDLSGLNFLRQRVDPFQTVGSTPPAYQFYFNNSSQYPEHKADHAMPVDIPSTGPAMVNFEDMYDYYRNTGSQYQQVGFGARLSGFPLSVRYGPIDTIYQFPLDHGDTDSSYSEYELSVPGYGVYKQEKVRMDTVDGYGTLKTPFGTFQILRVKSTLYLTDSLALDSSGVDTSFQRPVQVQYKWLAEGMGPPLLKITTQAGLITRIEYQDSLRFVTSTGERAEASASLEWTAEPVPASKRLTVTFNRPREGMVLLRNMAGRARKVHELRHTRSFDLDVEELPPGPYLLEYWYKERNLLTRKVIIARR